MEHDYLSTHEAAQQLGMSQRWITLLIERGQMRALRVGGVWILPRDAIEDYMRTRRPKGRPRKAASPETASLKKRAS